MCQVQSISRSMDLYSIHSLKLASLGSCMNERRSPMDLESTLPFVRDWLLAKLSWHWMGGMNSRQRKSAHRRSQEWTLADIAIGIPYTQIGISGIKSWTCKLVSERGYHRKSGDILTSQRNCLVPHLNLSCNWGACIVMLNHLKL